MRTQFHSSCVRIYFRFNDVSRGRKTNYHGTRVFRKVPRSVSFLYRMNQSSIRRRRLAKTLLVHARKIYFLSFSFSLFSPLRYYTCSRGKKLRINISLSGIRKLSRLYPANFRTPLLSSSLTYVSIRIFPRRGWLLRDLLYNFRLSLEEIEVSSFGVTTKVSRRSWEIQLMKQQIVGRYKETRERSSTTSITRHYKSLSLLSFLLLSLSLFLSLDFQYTYIIRIMTSMISAKKKCNANEWRLKR